MSSEQTTQEVTSQSQPTDQDIMEFLKRILQESGDSFAMMLPTLKQYMDALCKNIELIASLTLYEDLEADAKCQIYSFLLDCGIFLDILAKSNSKVNGIRNSLKALEEMDDYTPEKRPRGRMHTFCTLSCMGYLNYLQTSRPVYINFVRNLQLGQQILRSSSTSFRAKVTVIEFYLKYAREIRAISKYHRTARFAAGSCLLLKRENFDNAIEEDVSPDMLASVHYLRKYHEWQEKQEYELARTLIPNGTSTRTEQMEHE